MRTVIVLVLCSAAAVRADDAPPRPPSQALSADATPATGASVQPGAPPGAVGPMSQPVPPGAAPQAPGSDASIRHSHLADGEVIGDFATVGALASIDILSRQHITNGSAATLVLLAGLGGGAATGWLLTDQYDVGPGAARATSLGLLFGAANGALLIQPTGWTDGNQVLGLLAVGGAIGAAGGFAYGQTTELTSGQSTFVGNLALLGGATAALGAISGSRDGRFGNWEDAALAVGLDAGVLGGALIAPSLDWSPRRAKVVLASTTVGALLGGMLVGLITKPKNGDTSDANGDLVSGFMTAGMWGGFGLGILMTRYAEPDGRFRRPGGPVTLVPYAGRGQVGIMTNGSW